LRELSKVIEGMLLSREDHYRGEEGLRNLIDLFVHETKRVFIDRLISEEHSDIMM